MTVWSMTVWSMINEFPGTQSEVLLEGLSNTNTVLLLAQTRRTLCIFQIAFSIMVATDLIQSAPQRLLHRRHFTSFFKLSSAVLQSATSCLRAVGDRGRSNAADIHPSKRSSRVLLSFCASQLRLEDFYNLARGDRQEHVVGHGEVEHLSVNI